MAANTTRTERCKSLSYVGWNADGARGRKLELKYFLCQHRVDICLLNETFLNPGQAFRHANYFCQRTDRPTARGGKAILICPGIVKHSARSGPYPHGIYFHPSRICRQTGLNPCGLTFEFPFTYRSELDDLSRRGLPVFMTGDLPPNTWIGLEAEHETGESPM
jgi:hypothetical protein